MAAMQALQMLGALGAASYFAARLARASGRAAFHRYAIVAQPRAGLPAMPRGYRVDQLGPDQLAAYQVDASAEVQARRFGDGLACLAAFDRKDRLTGLIWLCAAAYDEDEVAVRFVLPEGCCWDTGLWVDPGHRLGRTFSALWAGVAEWMDARGLSHSLSRVSDYNLAALNAHRRMGATVLNHHAFWRLGDWQWAAAARPRLVRLRPGARAQLDLRGLAPLVGQG